MKHRCPICKKIIKVLAQEQSEKAEFFPFCSRRCKLIDLGDWLDAKYKITSGLQSPESVELSDTPSDAPDNKRRTEKT
jgi:endogenous inhibitor of DNA gyrase (YacG/DUF329 family)